MKRKGAKVLRRKEISSRLSTFAPLRFILFFSLLCSCTSQEPTRAFSGTAMGIPYQILTSNPCDQKAIETLIASTFEEIHQHSDNWNPDSEITALNLLLPNQRIPLSPHLLRLFQEIDEAVNLSEGLFDPTIEPLVTLWREKLLLGTIPSQEELQQLSLGWQHVHIENGQFWKSAPITLNFGGVAKGYCVDLLCERLIPYAPLYICWGGEIRVVGQHPTNRPWRCALLSPEGGVAKVIDLTGAIATSGDYYQLWEAESTLYTHICNPLTLNALTVNNDSIASATIQAETCLLADALATALMIGGEPLAQRLAPRPIELLTRISCDSYSLAVAYDERNTQ
ncbi:MAG: FAD:protein FMN transferase [Verrucomicrobia bacterium]|nr:FAD:protein FMN transferase [Verrucomicrobiota bacterium]